MYFNYLSLDPVNNIPDENSLLVNVNAALFKMIWMLHGENLEEKMFVETVPI